MTTGLELLFSCWVCVVVGEGWWAGGCGFKLPFSFLKEKVMHSHVIIHEALRAKFCYPFLLREFPLCADPAQSGSSLHWVRPFFSSFLCKLLKVLLLPKALCGPLIFTCCLLLSFSWHIVFNCRIISELIMVNQLKRRRISSMTQDLLLKQAKTVFKKKNWMCILLLY